MSTPTDLDAACADLDRTLDRILAGAGADPARTRHVMVERGALAAVGPWLRARGEAGPVWLVCDPNTRAAAADALAAHLTDAGFVHRLHVLEPQHAGEDLVCDAAAVDALQAAVAAHDAAAPAPAQVVAVGAGTVGDIAKMATHRLRRPLVTVATAASMNGYTSSIAAVLVDGVKRTLPAQQAQAVFADVDVLCRAPASMNLAGFGDLLSKPFSHADWLLAHLVRQVPYDEAPARLLDGAYEALLAAAGAIGRAEPGGVALLMRTILVSGFTMALAGTSAPASGGEHLVSHYWDMEQHCQGRPLRALHGTQVGIATRLSARLYEHLLAAPVDTLDVAAVVRHALPAARDLMAAHPLLTAAVVGEVREQWAAKQRLGAELRRELDDVRARWPEIRARLSAALVPAARIERALAQAGCPARPEDIGVDAEHAARTLRVCRQIRSRYVALDLLDDLGLLGPAIAYAMGAESSST